MADSIDVIRALGTRFIERRDVKAVQGEGVAWKPIREPFTMKDFEDHLAGRRTFGHYMVSPEGNCKLFAFDIDLRENKAAVVHDGREITPAFTGTYITKTSEPGEVFECDPRSAWQDPEHPAQWWLRHQLRSLAEGFASVTARIVQPLAVSVGYTGNKGLHVYGFVDSQPADVVRQLAQLVLDEFDCWEPIRGNTFYRHRFGHYDNFTVEVFPKQTSVNQEGVGNLMALPLGIHQVTKRRKFLCDFKVGWDEGWRERDPVDALNAATPWQ